MTTLDIITSKDGQSFEEICIRQIKQTMQSLDPNKQLIRYDPRNLQSVFPVLMTSIIIKTMDTG